MSVARSRVPQVDLRRLTGLLLWTILLLCILLNSAGVFAIDTKPEIYWAPARAVELFSQPWQPSPQLGWPNFNVGLTPVAAMVWVLHALGLDPTMSVRAFRLILYTVGALGIARLTRNMRGASSSSWPELIAAIVFVANPFAVVGASTNAVLMPYALLPWLSLAYINGLKSRSTWRWPAVFALVFFLMTGQNAGVIPFMQLLVLPVLGWWVRRDQGISWRHIVGVTVRCALLCVVVSLYWLIPSLIGSTQGVTVLNNSETLSGINATSSLAEVLRGLGMWSMYGGDVNGLWQPGFASYLNNPVVLVLSFGITAVFVAAALSVRTKARLPLVALGVVSAVLMAGLYPFPSGSPFGRLLEWIFTVVPATGAFRTLNKVGPLLIFSIALLAGLGAAGLGRRSYPRRVRVAAAIAAIMVATGSVWPALSGGLYPRQLPIPEYWQSAGNQVSQGSQEQRVWLAPGEVQSNYTWATDQPDDVALPLVSRPSVIRTTLPIASQITSNFLAAVDTRLQRGELVGDSLSRAAQIMGVDELLVRNDTRWSQFGGARPSTILQQANTDDGLSKPTGFGRRGQNIDRQPDYLEAHESKLNPVMVYPVKNPTSIVRAESPIGMDLVAGDGFALSQLTLAGLVTNRQSFRYLGDMDESEFASLLGPQRRLVLTDSNRRRDANLSQLVNNQGPLLAADTPLTSSRTLFSTDDQTVLKVEGGGQASATTADSDTDSMPDAAVENVNDGDPTTAWKFGGFETAVGKSVTVTLDHSEQIPALTFTQQNLGPVSISRVRVDFAGQQIDADVAASGQTRIVMPAGTGSQVKVEVLAIKGKGFNQVGIAELGIPGVALQRVAVMPNSIQRLASQLDPTQQQALASTPLDVLFQRQTGSGAWGAEETQLLRDFSTPDSRTYRPYGLLRAGVNIYDITYDAATGRGGPVTAHGSTRFENNLDWRGSQALDGDTTTAWVPAQSGVGSSLTVSGPAQRIDHITIDQLPDDFQDGKEVAASINRIDVNVDGRSVGQYKLKPGVNTVKFPAVSAAKSVIVTILGRQGREESPVGIRELGVGSWKIQSKKISKSPCLNAGTLDGKPFMIQPLEPMTPHGQALFVSCQGHVTLQAGQHQLRGGSDWVIDSMTLRDSIGEQVVDPGPVPTVTAVTKSGPSYDISVGQSFAPYYLVLANSDDTRWQLTGTQGQENSKPIVLDGMANAWEMPAGQSTTMSASFSTQSLSRWLWIISGIAVLVCAGMWFWARPRYGPAPRSLKRDTPRWSDGVRWSAVVLLATFLLGLPGLVASAVLAVVHAKWKPSDRLLRWVCGILVASLPVSWLVGYPGDWPLVVSSTAVHDNLWPQRFAAFLLVALVVAVLRQEGILHGRWRSKIPASATSSTDESDV